MDKIDGLISVLLDPSARIDERDDAAMDLGEEFDDEYVLAALIQVASNPDEIDMILNSCGEAIGKIWVKKDYFDEIVYKKLPKLTQDGIYFVIESRSPTWLEKFHLN